MSEEYYTSEQAFPFLLGGVDDKCRWNTDCQDGLRCTGGLCQLPPRVEQQCNRSHVDQRCHFLTNKGNKVLCSDSQCAPKSMDPPTPVDPVKCGRAQMYSHQSGASFCGSINQNTGQFEQMPEKCCHTALEHMWNLEPDYVKFSLAPQYYGTKW